MNTRRPSIALPCRTEAGTQPPRVRPVIDPRAIAAYLCIVPALVTGGGCTDGGNAAASLRIAQGDTVQVTAAQLGRGWHAATVGMAGNCTSILVPSPPPPEPPVSFTVLSFDSVTALRKGAELLPVDALRRAYGGCSPL